jgi:hypothetical protein
VVRRVHSLVLANGLIIHLVQSAGHKKYRAAIEHLIKHGVHVRTQVKLSNMEGSSTSRITDYSDTFLLGHNTVGFRWGYDALGLLYIDHAIYRK